VTISILIKTSVHPESSKDATNPRDCCARSRIDFESLRAECRRSMRDKSYQVRFKCSDLSPQLVIAVSVEIHGEHIVFLRSDGSLAAFFVLEIVESWPEVNSSGP
jgi:hypothetical protein